MTVFHQDYDAAVLRLLEHVGQKIVIGVPLGVGKPVGFLNALYRAAEKDKNISLTILTALTLGRPKLSNELEKRFVEPFLDRILKDYEELLYEEARVRQQLPPNIRVIEFFLSPGKYLKNAYVQQNYISANYSAAMQNFHAHGMNVVAQLVAHSKDKPNEYSVSCNSDVFQDAVDQMTLSHEKFAVLGEVNNNLPFMYGEAVIQSEEFTDMIDTGYYRTLFSLPHDELAISDHLIGLYTSALIKDDGCLQIGIGKLSTAVASALIFRHQHQEEYQAALKAVGAAEKFGATLSAVGETSVFRKGLYASTEMLGDDYVNLYRADILKKRVYDDLGLQTLLNEEKITETVTPEMLDVLLSHHIIREVLDESDIKFLVKFGIFRPSVRFEARQIFTEDGVKLDADLSNAATKQAIIQSCLGDRLKTGKLLHAAFILGSSDLYQQLSQLPYEIAHQFDMTTIDRTNTLIWSRDLLTAQRQHMRFVNSSMMVTLGSVVVSDGLTNMMEVSGVGGQFDFMRMAQDLKGSRAIINCRSTRKTKKGVESNIVWAYDNVTIPRYLRDIVVTEYGIADCRTLTDAEIIKAMLNITDSRFQQPLLKQAKKVGKLEANYEIPVAFQQNFPEKMESVIRQFQHKGFFPAFPFGTEFTETEITLEHALLRLKSKNSLQLLCLILSSVFDFSSDAPYQVYLQRMGLDKPKNFKEWLYKKILKTTLPKTRH